MVAKLADNHNTTQITTHILHNNQQIEPPPYPQRLCPLSPWVEQRAPKSWRRRSIMPYAGCKLLGLCSMLLVHQFGGQNERHQKIQRGRCLGLRCPPFSSHDATTNQMIVSVVGGALEIRRTRVGTCREDVFRCLGQQIEIEKK
jgi:hypothetical protein